MGYFANSTDLDKNHCHSTAVCSCGRLKTGQREFYTATSCIFIYKVLLMLFFLQKLVACVQTQKYKDKH